MTQHSKESVIAVILPLCTYNIRGFNFTKVKYIKDLLKLLEEKQLEEFGVWIKEPTMY